MASGRILWASLAAHSVMIYSFDCVYGIEYTDKNFTIQSIADLIAYHKRCITGFNESVEVLK